jgi:hypothetical protein
MPLMGVGDSPAARPPEAAQLLLSEVVQQKVLRDF